MTKVLLAEDNLTLLENIALELELRGYEVVQAVDGRCALDVLRTATNLPDIIVSDIAMPDMDGFKLLEHLRGDPAWNGIPFLFLTAFNSPNSMRIGKELGADDYIVKPFQADDLVLAMESKLKRVKAFQAQADRNLDDTRQTLLHMISHELRTPLTAIYGGSAVLADTLADLPDETARRMVELIQGGANRLNRFTGKALALLEIESGNLQKLYARSQQAHDIGEIIKSAVGVINDEIAADERSVTISLALMPQPVYVNGIFEYLVMMVEEPLRNAVAFSPDGATVEVVLSADESQVTVTTQDYGSGIPEADLPRVWDRFVQINRDHYEQQGAGIGLAIVRESARIHGGDCTIASELGKHTQVTLSLPRAQSPVSANGR